MAEAKVVLSAVDQTKAAIESAKRNMEGLGRTVEQTKTLLKAFIASEAVAYLINMAKSAIEAGDAMNDLSQRVGISVQDLAKYQLATAQSGTTMEALAKGIKGLSGTMLENGDVLRAAGITATTADKAMQQLADIFAGMPDGMQKTALAVKIFGKSGMELIPMLNLGSAGLREAEEKSAKYAATMKTLAPQADKFNDSLAEISMYSKAAGMSLMNDMMPALNDVAKAMAEAANKGGALKGVMAGLDALGNNLFDWSGNAQRKNIANLSNDLKTLREEQGAITLDLFGKKGQIQLEIEEKTKALNAARAAYYGLTDGNAGRGTSNPALVKPDRSAEGSNLLSRLSGKAGSSKEALSEYDKLIAKLGGDVAKAAAEAEAAQMGYNKAQTEFIALTSTKVWKEASDDQKIAVSAMYESRIASEMATEATKALDKANLEAASAREKHNVSLIEGLSKYQEESDALSESNARLGLNKEAIAALDAIKLESKAVTLELMAIKVLDKNLDESQYQIYKAQAEELRNQAKLKKQGAAKATEIEAKAAADKLSEEAAKSLHDDVKNALSTAFRDSKDPIGAFGDALGNVIFTRVTNSLADALATQLLNSAMVKSFTSIFGFSDGGIMSSAGPVPLKQYASGGIADRPQLALFGEGRMREAFVPLPDGRSIPVSMKGGSGSIVINISANIGDIASKADVVAGMRATASNIVQQIQRSQRYGGALA